MAREFAGSGGQKIVFSPASTQDSLTVISISIWFQRQSGGEFGYGRLLAKAVSPGSTTDTWQLFNNNGDGGEGMNWEFRFSGTDGRWSVPYPSNNVWHNYVITYDAGATTNDPLVWLDGVAQTVTERATPTGTRDASTGELYVGVAADGTEWDGPVAEAAIWNRILNPGEAEALGKGFSPMLFDNGLVFYSPLIGRSSPEPDLISGNLGTVTGATHFNHPTIFRPGMPFLFPHSVGGTNYTRSLSDNITSTDSLQRTISAARSQSDIASIADHISRLFSTLRSRAESVSVYDSLTAQISGFIYRFLSNNINVADSPRKTSSFLRDLPKSKELGYLTQGSSSSTDIQGSVLGSKFTLSEQARITKYSFTLLTVGTEQIKCAIYDSSLNLVSGSETAITNISTSSQKIWVNIPLLSPVLLSAGDYYLVMWGKGDAISLDYYDAGSTNQSFVKSGLTFTDPFPSSITGQTPNDNKYSIYGSYNNAEGIAVADSLSAGLAGIISAFLSDAITTTDSLKSAASFGRFQSDVATVADQVSRLLSAIRSNADLVRIQDALTAQISGFIYRFLTDNITSSDSLKRTVSSSRSPSEAVSATDTVSRISAFSRSESDLLGVSDALTYLLSQIIAIALSDAIGVQDSNRRIVSVDRSLVDGMNIQDSIKRLYSSVRSLSDVASVSEQTSLLIAIFRTLADSQSITDVVSYEIAVSSNNDGGKAPVIDSIIVTPFIEGQSLAGVYDDHKAYDTHIPYYVGQSNDVAPTVYK